MVCIVSGHRIDPKKSWCLFKKKSSFHVLGSLLSRYNFLVTIKAIKSPKTSRSFLGLNVKIVRFSCRFWWIWWLYLNSRTFENNLSDLDRCEQCDLYNGNSSKLNITRSLWEGIHTVDTVKTKLGVHVYTELVLEGLKWSKYVLPVSCSHGVIMERLHTWNRNIQV